jgi:two-component system KDP operon response regulator KdpE
MAPTIPDKPASDQPAADMPRILVVDRHLPIRRVVTVLLTLEGYAVGAVADAATALRLLTSSQPDLLIVDDDSCGTLVNALRHGPWRVPILLLSAQEDGCRLAVQEGITACHPKPFDLAALVETVRQLCTTGARSTPIERVGP